MSETSLPKQLIALVLATKNKETKHHIHPKLERTTEKNCSSSRTIYTLIWYGFYDLWLGNRVGPVLTAPEPTRGREGGRIEFSTKVCQNIVAFH